MAMYTYQMSNMIRDRIGHVDLEGEESTDYAFDLNEFFPPGRMGVFFMKPR